MLDNFISASYQLDAMIDHKFSDTRRGEVHIGEQTHQA